MNNDAVQDWNLCCFIMENVIENNLWLHFRNDVWKRLTFELIDAKKTVPMDFRIKETKMNHV